MKAIIPFKIFVLTISMLIATTLSAFSASGYTPIYDKGWIGWSGEEKHDFETLFDPADYDADDYPGLDDSLRRIYLDTEERGIAEYSFDTFAVYIPPETKQIDLTVTTENNAHVGFAVRFNLPPQNNYSSFSYADCNDWEKNNSITYPGELEGSDYLFRNWEGLMSIFANGNFPDPIPDAGWLYIKVLGEKNRIKRVTYKQDVDSGKYETWYDSFDWDNGEPPGDVSSGTSDGGDSGSDDSSTDDT